MAKINIRPDEMVLLSERLGRISSVIQDAESMTRKVQNNLDFEVAAKQGIASRLRSARTNLHSQCNKVSELARLTAVSNEEFMVADGQMDKNARNILRRISTPVAGVIQKIVKFFAGVSIDRYALTSALFFSTGSVIASVGISELMRRLRKITGSTPTGGTTGGGAVAGGSGAAGGSGGGTVPVSQSYEKLVSFPSEAYAGKTNGNYADYSIVGGMKPEFVINQHNFSKEGFAANGCTSSTYWTIASAYNGKEMGKPTDSYISGVGAANDKSKNNPATIWSDTSNYTTAEQYLETIYNNLIRGIPMGARMKSLSGASGHTVSCIGLKNGTSIESFKASLAALDKSAPDYKVRYEAIISDFQKNILISDSADGKIKTLDSYQFKIGKSLWYPDGASVVK